MFSGLLSDIRAGVIAQMFRARLVSPEERKQELAQPQPTTAETNGSERKRHKKSRKRH